MISRWQWLPATQLLAGAACESRSLLGGFQYTVSMLLKKKNHSLKVLPALNYFIKFSIKSYVHTRLITKLMGCNAWLPAARQPSNPG